MWSLLTFGARSVVLIEPLLCQWRTKLGRSFHQSAYDKLGQKSPACEGGKVEPIRKFNQNGKSRGKKKALPGLCCLIKALSAFFFFFTWKPICGGKKLFLYVTFWVEKMKRKDVNKHMLLWTNTLLEYIALEKKKMATDNVLISPITCEKRALISSTFSLCTYRTVPRVSLWFWCRANWVCVAFPRSSSLLSLHQWPSCWRTTTLCKVPVSLVASKPRRWSFTGDRATAQTAPSTASTAGDSPSRWESYPRSRSLSQA